MKSKKSNELGIAMYLHCGECIASLPDGMSPRDWAHLSVGFTKEGLQVWCVRHDCNVIHIDFEGEQHPADLSAAGEGKKGKGKPTCSGVGKLDTEGGLKKGEAPRPSDLWAAISRPRRSRS